MTAATRQSRDKVMIGTCVLKERKRPAGATPFWKLRVLEIEKVIRARHGTIPETDDVPCAYMFALAHTAHAAFDTHEDQASFIVEWLGKFAAWVVDPEGVAAKLLTKMHPRRRHMTAGAVASHLRVTYAERTELGLHTISAYDKKKDELRDLARGRKRERDRSRAEAKRRANGSKPRHESLSQTRPWDRDGDSRRTWERRRKLVNDANSSPPLQPEESTRDANPSPLLKMADFGDDANSSRVRESWITGDESASRAVTATLVPDEDDLTPARGAGLKPRAVSRRPTIQLDLFEVDGEAR